MAKGKKNPTDWGTREALAGKDAAYAIRHIMLLELDNIYKGKRSRLKPLLREWFHNDAEMIDDVLIGIEGWLKVLKEYGTKKQKIRFV